MKRMILFLAVLFASTLSACNGNDTQMASKEASGDALYLVTPTFAAETDLVSRGGSSTTERTTQQRIVVKNAILSTVADTPETVTDMINQMAVDMGGWVVQSNVQRNQGTANDAVTFASTVIRVPADQLDAALAAIKAQATMVLSESITGDDVTEEYTDISSRISSLEAAESQLLQIMESAESTQDVLDVYNQITDIRTEID